MGAKWGERNTSKYWAEGKRGIFFSSKKVKNKNIKYIRDENF